MPLDQFGAPATSRANKWYCAERVGYAEPGDLDDWTMPLGFDPLSGGMVNLLGRLFLSLTLRFTSSVRKTSGGPRCSTRLSFTAIATGTTGPPFRSPGKAVSLD
jgi:hypothetical protein